MSVSHALQVSCPSGLVQRWLGCADSTLATHKHIKFGTRVPFTCHDILVLLTQERRNKKVTMICAMLVLSQRTCLGCKHQVYIYSFQIKEYEYPNLYIETIYPTIITSHSSEVKKKQIISIAYYNSHPFLYDDAH